jgi:hypothetical protein
MKIMKEYMYLLLLNYRKIIIALIVGSLLLLLYPWFSWYVRSDTVNIKYKFQYQIPEYIKDDLIITCEPPENVLISMTWGDETPYYYSYEPSLFSEKKIGSISSKFNECLFDEIRYRPNNSDLFTYTFSDNFEKGSLADKEIDQEVVNLVNQAEKSIRLEDQKKKKKFFWNFF